MNYIARKKEFEILEDGKLLIDNKIYTYNDNLDPQYIDGILDISYYPIIDEDGEQTNMMFAFDKREDVSEPQEWGDVYDAEHPYVLQLI